MTDKTTFPIFIRMILNREYHTFTFAVSSHDEIGHIASLIADKTSIPCKHINISYRSRNLVKTESIKFYSISRDSTLNAMTRCNHNWTFILKVPAKILTQQLIISPSSTVYQLKQMISNMYPLNGRSFKILINNETNFKSLDDEFLYLKDYDDVHNEQILYITYWQSTSITVKILDDRHCELQYVKPTETVLDLKMKIQKEMRIYHQVQKLIYAGKQLEDDWTLMNANIGEHCTIYLVLRVKDCSWRFNELLCDNDISLMDTYPLNVDLYSKMKAQWMRSSRSKTKRLKLVKVYKINKNFEQNMNIYNAVLSTKKTNGKHKKEDMLFHGTSLENIHKIINTGFNRDYNIKSLYGKGTYFSNIAGIAAKYCSKMDDVLLAMLACKTYIGESTKGKQLMTKNELYKKDKVTQYDSLVNDLNNPSIFVINRDYQSVPCFIIVFNIKEINNK